MNKNDATGGQPVAAGGVVTIAAVKNQSSTVYPSFQVPTSRHARAALRYAGMGLAVFPLHEPIFDAGGHVTGCTCEDYKRSDRYRRQLEAQGKGHFFDPNFKCDQPGKCPRVRWRAASTTDAGEISAWWSRWPNANIGIDCGKSGLLVLDADIYKEHYAGGDLDGLNEETVTALTGGGGVHLWYRQPEGASYGNSTGTLAAGLDVRGVGGYVVAPPSVHKSGRRYVFEANYGPHDLAIADMPAQLRAQLDAATPGRQARAAAAVAFSAPPDGEPPDLGQWRLSPAVVELLEQPPPRGQRSEADAKAVTALCYAGATDDQIRAVFTHYPLGREGKYRERGDDYLATTIGHARAYIEAHPPAAPLLLPDDPNMPLETILCAARDWLKTAACADALRSAGVKRVEGPRRTLDGLLDLAAEKRSLRFLPGLREVGAAGGCSHMSARRHLLALRAAGLVEVEETAAGLVVSLRSLTVTAFKKSPDCERCNTYRSQPFYSAHRADDAFQSYPYRYAIARRAAPIVLLASLGAAALLAWDALLEHGELTAGALAEETGMSLAAAREALRRLARGGYAESWQENRRSAKVFTLLETAAERLEARRPEMVTGGLGQLRALRQADARASWATWQHRMTRAGDTRERARLEEKRRRADALSLAFADALHGLGIDPKKRVHQRPPKRRTRYDYQELLVVWQVWKTLDGSPDDRRRQMVYAGYSGDELEAALRCSPRLDRLYARQCALEGVGHD